MVNVHDNVIQWFRDAASNNRLEVLCRLLECCVPLELQYLATYLEELLHRNMVLTNPVPSDTTCSNLIHLREITDSNCRRQLCVLLTRLKSVNKIPAYNIYDILIRYDFSQFFSRVISMEEELVDEILLLFTLAANHPAMTFSQRNRLHERLVDLRETIDHSFKCCQIDVDSHDASKEYICFPLESENTTSKVPERLASELDAAVATIASKEETKESKENREVHIKGLRIVKVQQRPYDKKYEYVFEFDLSTRCPSRGSLSSLAATTNVSVLTQSGQLPSRFQPYPSPAASTSKRRTSGSVGRTKENLEERYRFYHFRFWKKQPLEESVTWSNGKVIKIHRAYGELFDFQCKLRRRYTKDVVKVPGRRGIPYLPPRRPIKFCKGNDILPDISNYVREFAQLPDKLLHNEWVENFFSDGNERDLDEPNKNTMKSNDNAGEDKKESVVSKQKETMHANDDVKPEKGHGMLRKHSPKAKSQTSISCKNSTISQTYGKQSTKRNITSPKNTHLETTTSNKDGNEVKTINHPPEVNSKSPTSPASRLIISPVNKIQIDSQENETIVALTSENQEVVTKTLVSITTSSPQINSETMNGHQHHVNSETIVEDEKAVGKMDEISTIAPLTVAVSINSPVCSACSALNQSSSEGSLTSLISMSPFGSPVTSFTLGRSTSPSLSSSPELRHFDFSVVTCPTETSNVFKDFTDEQVLGLCDSDIDKMDMARARTDRETLKSSISRLKSSPRGIHRNGYCENNVHSSLSQNGLLIVPNGFTHFTTSSKTVAGYETMNGVGSKTNIPDQNCNYISQSGEHKMDVNSNKTNGCKQETHLNEQSNGFCKPYCFNCGRYGHVGHCCVETQVEGPSVS